MREQRRTGDDTNVGSVIPPQPVNGVAYPRCSLPSESGKNTRPSMEIVCAPTEAQMLEDWGASKNTRDSEPAMEIAYFISAFHPYEKAIYAGVGPSFARPFGWRVETIERLGETVCDFGIIDNRLEPEDLPIIESFLARPLRQRFPICFRLSDTDQPRQQHQTGIGFIFSKANTPGVHFVLTYEPKGPMLEFTQTLTISGVARLSYPYERRREVDRDMADRQRRVFLSGANSAALYPLRASLRGRRIWNPILWWAVSDLKHPGYPKDGMRLAHNIVGDRYVNYASGYSHFFLCPTVYRVELSKYIECAYAGCVPIGQAPTSLHRSIDQYLVPSVGKATELIHALAMDKLELRERAAGYRCMMQSLREPAKLASDLEDQLRHIV